MGLSSIKTATNHAHNTQEIQEYVKMTVSKMMSSFAQATKNTINNTFEDKLKSIEKLSTSTTRTKNKLHSKIKSLEQQLTTAMKTGEGIKTPPKNGPEEWQQKNVRPSVNVDDKTWWWCSKHF